LEIFQQRPGPEKRLDEQSEGAHIAQHLCPVERPAREDQKPLPQPADRLEPAVFFSPEKKHVIPASTSASNSAMPGKICPPVPPAVIKIFMPQHPRLPYRLLIWIRQ
jgi:hypothetical protein